MHYNFDKVIDRSGTNAMSMHGFRDYLFGEYKELSLDYQDEDLISMWVADMEFQTAPEIIDALQKRVAHGVFGYTQVFDQRCKQALIRWAVERYDHRFSLDEIVLSSGVIPALQTMASMHCGVGDKILFLTPSYAFFEHAASFHKVETVYSPLKMIDGRYRIDWEDLEKKASDPKVKLTFFCSPYNPSGHLWTDAELKRYGDICLAHDVTIIADEIHCDLLRVGKKFIPMAKLFPYNKNIITCMAPSKTFNLAGMQIAFVVIPNPEQRDEWLRRHFPIVNPLSTTAAEAAYVHGGDWLSHLKEYLDDNFQFLKSFLTEHLPHAKFDIPDATYLAWIDMSHYLEKDQDATYLFAKEAGVLLEGGKMFVDNADGFIRLNLACPRGRLQEGLERISSLFSR